jgi:hypothetical protein
MDRAEAAHKKARLAPPPTKQGWLHKKGGTALSAERKRWFVLQGAGSEATLRYSKEVNGGHRGTIRCEDIRGVVQDDNTLDIYTPDRTYHVRASSEQSAGQWATVIRCAAAGAEEVESSSDEEEDENTGIPWMIDGAWVDQRAPAPLRTVAALGAVPDGEHAAHVRLADGSTLTADVTAGEQVEVATAGSSTLVAALEDTTPPQPPSLLGTACASVALGLVGSAFVPRAATAGLLLAGAAAASVKRKREAPQKRYDLVLTTRIEPDAEQPLRKRRRSGELLARRPSLVGIRSPNPQQRRPSLFSPQKAKCPDFSGTYVLDHNASDSNDEMMAALGVPWVARRAIRGTKRTIHIEHDGDVWDETTVTKFRTMEDHFDLSGGSLVKISPVDKSSYTTTTTIQSGAIVTAVDFGVPNKSQVITRRLDGKRYVVLNELSLKGRVLKVRSVFNRVDDRVVGG